MSQKKRLAQQQRGGGTSPVPISVTPSAHRDGRVPEGEPPCPGQTWRRGQGQRAAPPHTAHPAPLGRCGSPPRDHQRGCGHGRRAAAPNHTERPGTTRGGFLLEMGPQKPPPNLPFSCRKSTSAPSKGGPPSPAKGRLEPGFTGGFGAHGRAPRHSVTADTRTPPARPQSRRCPARGRGFSFCLPNSCFITSV